MTAAEARRHGLGAPRGILIATPPALLLWAALIALVVLLAGCGVGAPSPAEKAQRAWDEATIDKAEFCEAYMLLGPVVVNEMIETMGADSDLSPDEIDAFKGLALRECANL